MLHAAGFLMSWLTGKRAHIFSISLSLFSHSRLSHLLALFCSVSFTTFSTFKSYFCTFLHHTLVLALQTVLCPAVTLLLSVPLFCQLCFLLPLSLFVSSSPPSIFLLASLFCAMPQGPPGPQGSPHPQPPPPNSMMGPHSQVTLPLPLSRFFSVCCLRSFGNAWFSVLMLHALAFVSA